MQTPYPPKDDVDRPQQAELDKLRVEWDRRLACLQLLDSHERALQFMSEPIELTGKLMAGDGH